ARAAKIGTTDAPGEADAPLRAAAFEAKKLVDQGPYEALNRFYAEGAKKLEGARKDLGLKGKKGPSEDADVKRLGASLRRSVSDPNALPDRTDMHDFARRQADAAGLRADQNARILQAIEAAKPDRRLLGLNDRIGTDKTDTNQIRLALERQTSNSKVGGAGPDLDAFARAHPDLRTAVDLPRLAKARADLAFHVQPHHGGLAARAGGGLAPLALGYGALTHPLATLGALGVQNATPLAGRLLYRPAQAFRAPAFGGRLGAAEGAAPDRAELERQLAALGR